MWKDRSPSTEKRNTFQWWRFSHLTKPRNPLIPIFTATEGRVYHCDKETHAVSKRTWKCFGERCERRKCHSRFLTPPNTSVTTDGKVFENLGPDSVFPLRRSGGKTKGVLQNASSPRTRSHCSHHNLWRWSQETTDTRLKHIVQLGLRVDQRDKLRSLLPILLTSATARSLSIQEYWAWLS